MAWRAPRHPMAAVAALAFSLGAGSLLADVRVETTLDPLLANFEVEPLTDLVLSEQRGGFTTAEGLTIALGIAELIRVDGQLIAEQSWRISPLSLNQLLNGEDRTPIAVTLERHAAAAAAVAPAEIAVVSQLNPDTLGLTTVVQNERNGRLIETLRTIDIDLTNLGRLHPRDQFTRSVLREYRVFTFP